MENNKKSIVRVNILNEEFTLSAEQPEEMLRGIAGYVDGKMKEIYKNLPSASYKRIAVLAALNISEELYALKKQGQENPKVLERAEELIKKIDINFAE